MNSAGVKTTPLARALAVSATMRSAPVPARIAPSIRAGSRPARTIAADRSAGSWWRADSSSWVMAQKRPWAAAASAASARTAACGWATGLGKWRHAIATVTTREWLVHGSAHHAQLVADVRDTGSPGRRHQRGVVVGARAHRPRERDGIAADGHGDGIRADDRVDADRVGDALGDVVGRDGEDDAQPIVDGSDAGDGPRVALGPIALRGQVDQPRQGDRAVADGDVDGGGSHGPVRVERVEHRRLGVGVGEPRRVEEPETQAVRDAVDAGHLTCRANGRFALDDGADGPPEGDVAAEGLHGDLVRVDARVAGQRLHDVLFQGVHGHHSRSAGGATSSDAAAPAYRPAMPERWPGPGSGR